MSDVIRHGLVVMDIARHKVWLDNKRLHRLSPKEFHLLRLFLESNGVTLSIDELLRKIWGEEYANQGVKHYVVGLVGRLRRRVGANLNIEAVVGIGYRLEPLAPDRDICPHCGK